jgi:hypothetical protein
MAMGYMLMWRSSSVSWILNLQQSFQNIQLNVGQIDFYVLLFNDKIKLSDDNPTMGIILCTDKDENII